MGWGLSTTKLKTRVWKLTLANGTHYIRVMFVNNNLRVSQEICYRTSIWSFLRCFCQSQRCDSSDYKQSNKTEFFPFLSLEIGLFKSYITQDPLHFWQWNSIKQQIHLKQYAWWHCNSTLWMCFIMCRNFNKYVS